MQNSGELHENAASDSPPESNTGKNASLKKHFRKKERTRKSMWFAGCFVLLAICCMADHFFNRPPEDPEYDPEKFELSADCSEFPYLQLTETDISELPEKAVSIALREYSDLCEIKKGGDYILSGDLSGSVRIDARDENVHLFLDGVSITSRSGPAILCGNADKLIITLLPETENTVSDSDDYRAYSAAEACIYSACSLTINGTGKLSAAGFYKDAIRSKDILKVLNSNIMVKCKETGLRGNDGIIIKNADVSISTEKTGIKTKNAGENGRGNVVVDGGALSVIAGRYSFELAEGDLYIADCRVNSKSVISSCKTGGSMYIQEGCI